MRKPEVDEIVRKNPHLDLESLEALMQYLQRVGAGQNNRYRLAPIGERPVVREHHRWREGRRPRKHYPPF